MTDVLVKMWRMKRVWRTRKIPIKADNPYDSGFVYARREYCISENVCMRIPNTTLADLRGESIDRIIDECKLGSRPVEGVSNVKRKLLSDKRYYTPY